MKNYSIIIIILFWLQTNAQGDLSSKHFKFKGKLEKNTLLETCGSEYSKEIAIVLEITITSPEDIKRFGEKIYVAQICYEIPGEGVFNGKEHDIEIRDKQMWQWKISILNPQLFEKNRDKKEYWLEDVSRKVTIH
ncbi:hypothetical protein [Flavobacterium crassostreae]|uniref:Uncharacterized protein n=1 Tax=Flavobacterium crassostreae TaxID=1763534 RepID=A0A1B9DJM6_9FLAO|nr:hypothetical protein [Flavobacterium crassostreae]OCB69887.1 hypothetical protein LPBF_12440 [Flavobacterium crassostreae]